LLHAERGCVSPLGLLYDTEQKVAFVLDKALTGQDSTLNMHPCTNEITISIPQPLFQTFLKKYAPKHKVIDFTAAPPARGNRSSSQNKPKKQHKKQKPNQKQKKKQTRRNLLGLAYKKADNFAKWYADLVVKAELIEYSDISGCYILRPDSYFIWECIQEFMNARLKRSGVRNVYFPLFISKRRLYKVSLATDVQREREREGERKKQREPNERGRMRLQTFPSDLLAYDVYLCVVAGVCITLLLIIIRKKSTLKDLLLKLPG